MKIRRFAALLLLTALLGGCFAVSAGASAVPGAQEREVGYYFDTVVVITLYDAEEGLMQEIFDACARYEALLSRTVEGSDVWRVNHAGGEPVQVDSETADILRAALRISEMSGRAFCVSIAPVTELWDFSHGTKRMPTDEERLAALPLVDDAKVRVDGNTVSLDDGMEIDLGGIAKGYIADRVADLTRGRVSGAILNFGGNTYVLGHKPDGKPFRVGVQDPWGETGTPLMAVTLTDTSVVTSGTYERHFEVDGVEYHHILDPATGLPARTGLISATIVCDCSMEADALATACIVKGRDEALALLEAEGYHGILIGEDHEIVTTADFPWEIAGLLNR